MESSEKPLTFESRIKSIHVLNQNWMYNASENPDKTKKFERYDCFTCCMLEAQYQKFLESNKDEKYQCMIIGGGYSIDFLFMVQYRTNQTKRQR